MATEAEWTIGKLLKWTTDYFQQYGADSPRLDAEVLLAEAVRCERIQLYTSFDETPDPTTRSTFRELVRRRCDGTPVAYLIGRREFFSLSFQTNPDVLIPRPETEFIVVALLDLVKKDPPTDNLQIADVGTGSGILAICAARHIPDCQVVATDISARALEVARANTIDHQVDDRIQLVEGDLLSGFPAEPQFDYIVSNPPYVAQSELETLAREIRDFEPQQALVAGPLGSEIYQRLIPQAAERLRPGGALIIEIGPAVQQAVLTLVNHSDQFIESYLVKDLADLPRVIVAKKA